MNKTLKQILALVLLPVTLALAASPAGMNREASNFFNRDGYSDLGSLTLGHRPYDIFVTDGVNIGGGMEQHVTVNLSSANILAMSATPVQLIAAPGSGKTIVVDKIVFTITRTSTAYANGGAVIFQYGNTATGGGQQSADSTLASTVITGAAGTTVSLRNGAVISDLASTSIQNLGLFISNQTAAFITGTGTAVVDVWYYVD
jgi:hypothetical protein